MVERRKRRTTREDDKGDVEGRDGMCGGGDGVVFSLSAHLVVSCPSAKGLKSIREYYGKGSCAPR